MQDRVQIRRELTKIALQIRRSFIKNYPLNKPLSATDFEFSLAGKEYRRRKIHLAASGCVVATCTMCSIPNEAFRDERSIPSSENLIRQFHTAFENESLDSYELISVYNSGNWFADAEVPANVRQTIYHAIATSKCGGIMIETLPHFVTKDVISEAQIHLGDKKLIVAMGLQSADDLVREVCINAVCTRGEFERATHLLWSSGYSARVYLMIKPSFLTDQEAIEDTVRRCGGARHQT